MIYRVKKIVKRLGILGFINLGKSRELLYCEVLEKVVGILDLGYNEIKEIKGLNGVKNLPKLKTLIMHGNQFTYNSIKAIRNTNFKIEYWVLMAAN